MQHSLEKIPFAGRKKCIRCNNLMLLQKQSNISIKSKNWPFQKTPKYLQKYMKNSEQKNTQPKFNTKRNHIFCDKQNQYTILLQELTHIILSSWLVINPINNISKNKTKQNKKFSLKSSLNCLNSQYTHRNDVISIRNSCAIKYQRLLERRSFKWCVYHIGLSSPICQLQPLNRYFPKKFIFKTQFCIVLIFQFYKMFDLSSKWNKEWELNFYSLIILRLLFSFFLFLFFFFIKRV